jgi:hypothetical protein
MMTQVQFLGRGRAERGRGNFYALMGSRIKGIYHLGSIGSKNRTLPEIG